MSEQDHGVAADAAALPPSGLSPCGSQAEPAAANAARITNENVHLKVQEADERLASFVAALDSAGSYDAKRGLWLDAIEDGQFETDLRILFGVLSTEPDGEVA